MRQKDTRFYFPVRQFTDSSDPSEINPEQTLIFYTVGGKWTPGKNPEHF